MLLFACVMHAEERTFRIFGSAGNEGHFLSANPSSPLNPANILGVPERGNSADFTAYAELVPESHAWKIHAKVRATDEDTPGHITRGELGELYAQMSVASWLDVTVGRRIEKWGTGYAWNPTGFVNPQKNAGDPNDRRNAYRGVDMLKADATFHDTNVSAYVLEHGWAIRGYRLIHGTDVALQVARLDCGNASCRSGTAGNAAPGVAALQMGLSLAKTFGDALELHGEAASIDHHAELVAGGQYTFRNDVNLVAEVFHGGAGLSTSQWNEYRANVDEAQSDLSRLAEVNREYVPLHMGRNYAFVRVAWPVIAQRLDVEALTISSLRDGSTFLRTAITWKPQPRLALYVVETEFVAGDRSEFDYVQVRRLMDVGLRIYF
jgi:hypothetical protein